MNEDQKQKLILNISNFHMFFQKEILDLLFDNNQGLSPLLFKALHEIYFYGDITPSTLSKRLCITIPNASRTLHSLIEMDYITKKKDSVDKRITHIELSQKGLNVVQSSLKFMDEVLLRKLGVLSPDELVKISEAFFILTGMFEKIETLD